MGGAAGAASAAWAAFGALLMAAAALTQRLLQPRLYAHRPLPLFTGEFARWWLVQRLVGTINVLFAEQLRGTPMLVWWFRMLVRASHPRRCATHRAAVPRLPASSDGSGDAGSPNTLAFCRPTVFTCLWCVVCGC